jgi:hypothetical protein
MIAADFLPVVRGLANVGLGFQGHVHAVLQPKQCIVRCLAGEGHEIQPLERDLICEKRAGSQP